MDIWLLYLHNYIFLTYTNISYDIAYPKIYYDIIDITITIIINSTPFLCQNL